MWSGRWWISEGSFFLATLFVMGVQKKGRHHKFMCCLLCEPSIGPHYSATTCLFDVTTSGSTLALVLVSLFLPRLAAAFVSWSYTVICYLFLLSSIPLFCRKHILWLRCCECDVMSFFLWPFCHV
jgi:hypothetical protein